MFILVIAGTGTWQNPFPRYFPNTKKYAHVSPGNPFMLDILAGTATFDMDQAANTHTTENFMVPMDCEVIALNFLANAAQVWTDDNLNLAIGLPGSNVTTVSLAIASHTFVDGAAAGDVVEGTYKSSTTGSNVVKAHTLYEGGVVVRPTGGIVTAVAKAIQVWLRPIPNTEN